MIKVLLLETNFDNQYIMKYFNMINKQLVKVEMIDYPIVEYLNLDLQYTSIISYDNIILDTLIGFAYLEALMSKYSFLHSSIMLKKKLWMIKIFDNAELIVKNNIIIKHNADNICDIINIIPKEIYKNTIFLSSENYDIEKIPKTIKIQNIFKKIYLNELHNIDIIYDNISYILLSNKKIALHFIKLLQEKNLLIYLQNAIVITCTDEIKQILLPFFKKVICSDANHMSDLSKSLYQHITYPIN